MAAIKKSIAPKRGAISCPTAQMNNYTPPGSSAHQGAGQADAAPRAVCSLVVADEIVLRIVEATLFEDLLDRVYLEPFKWELAQIRRYLIVWSGTPEVSWRCGLVWRDGSCYVSLVSKKTCSAWTGDNGRQEINTPIWREGPPGSQISGRPNAQQCCDRC